MTFEILTKKRTCLSYCYPLQFETNPLENWTFCMTDGIYCVLGRLQKNTCLATIFNIDDGFCVNFLLKHSFDVPCLPSLPGKTK